MPVSQQKIKTTENIRGLNSDRKHFDKHLDKHFFVEKNYQFDLTLSKNNLNLFKLTKKYLFKGLLKKITGKNDYHTIFSIEPLHGIVR